MLFLSRLALYDIKFLTFLFIYFQHKDNIVIVPEPLDLVNISQSRCSPSDLLRMRDILATKLETNPGAGPEQPITALTMLRYLNVLIQQMIISYTICQFPFFFEDLFSIQFLNRLFFSTTYILNVFFFAISELMC